MHSLVRGCRRRCSRNPRVCRGESGEPAMRMHKSAANGYSSQSSEATQRSQPRSQQCFACRSCDCCLLAASRNDAMSEIEAALNFCSASRVSLCDSLTIAAAPAGVHRQGSRSASRASRFRFRVSSAAFQRACWISRCASSVRLSCASAPAPACHPVCHAFPRSLSRRRAESAGGAPRCDDEGAR